MEDIRDNRTHEQIRRSQGWLKGLGSPGLSILVEPIIPSEEELAAIEARGYVCEEVQAFIDDLQRKTPEGTKQAAMLRGAFNDLITRNEELETEVHDLHLRFGETEE